MSTPSTTKIAEWRRATGTITPAPVELQIPVKRIWSAEKGYVRKKE
jgi:hypothetical protein